MLFPPSAARPLAWLGLLLVLLPVALLPACAPADTRAPGLTVIEAARAVDAASDEPPPFDPAAATRPLPDAWAASAPAGGTRWYRASFDADNGGAAPMLALYLERACARLEVRLNGGLLHRDAPAGPGACGRPLLLPLPPALLRSGSNELVLKLSDPAPAEAATGQHAGGLSVLRIGPRERLEAPHPWRAALATTLPAIVSTGLLLLGGIALLRRAAGARAARAPGAAPARAPVVQAIEPHVQQLVEQRVEEVTARERKRIAADLHDDLGARLLTIVHTSESERVSALAREALDEMRLAVRGLTGRPVPLAEALGDWRAEAVTRLGQAGIETRWQAPDDLPQVLAARTCVQATRILREAVSNVIRHSGATRCEVECTVAGDWLEIVLRDDGRGLPPASDPRLARGHGLTSMAHRARQLHGRCVVEPAPEGGTVMRLTLALGAEGEAP